MRFVLDENIPSGLAGWFQAQRHVCRHVSELGLTSSSDRSIWAFAVQDGAAIITRDRDYSIRRKARDDGPAVIWLRFPNFKTKAFIARFAPYWPDVEQRLRDGQLLIEVPPPSTP